MSTCQSAEIALAALRERDKFVECCAASPEKAYAELICAGRNFLDAFGGDVPKWLQIEAKALSAALEKVSKL